MEQEKRPYVGYEYKKITVSDENASWYLDCYEAFGWEQDTHTAPISSPSKGGKRASITLSLKRDRKIINKAELTRLQRNFEACAKELDRLERSARSQATMWALIAGVIGTAFMAGSVFAVTHEPPIIWLCVLLAIPGFIGWIVPYFLCRSIEAKHTAKIQPMLEAKQEEIYILCEKGHRLL